MSLNIGDKFKLSNDAIETYGEQYRDKVFTVRTWAINYVPAKEYYECPQHYPHSHPGYDSGVKERLYEANNMPFAVYDREIIKV